MQISHQLESFMPRQSITFTEPNEEWVRAQVESKEYSSKSDLINDLIRRARKEQEELDLLRKKLIQSEQSGLNSRSPEQIRMEARKRLNGDE